ncbi:hypothetical protein OD917_11330 [Flavobacterium sp. SH_e]|uniref:hypothetical protein n=1 Tax=Flavobacterium TaxID=237 RepID=UPI0021E3E0F0|nr:hypothetical protein [Flavobacterium sp. SH_e]MCV2485520.1 hypothetical protein [Flavobacterium sp. SH_e]
MEKFEIDIKWGSYLFIANAAISIVISLLMLLVDYQSLRYLSNILILVFIVQLIYFTIKSISENNKNGLSKGYRKFFVFVRLLMFFYLLTSFLNGSAITSTGSWYLSLFVPYREKDISELLVEDDPKENNGITLNEFIVALKRKFSR